ncbi:DUF221-domain-containing protein [Trichodelitschia bisporula]|uniref:DUF221-domain-containing protein n=1 Tax=Trichodelitschia bisporula TaxID=703511 RepID=A0A6G1HYH7_9PEZI|nr:DUF221-domain-containing protein [Trichodelitschia bisporula]
MASNTSNSSSLLDQSAAAVAARTSSGQTIQTFLASLGGSFTLFAVQITVFYLLRDKFTRIYRPKTYLVPGKARVEPPPPGFFKWIKPVFKTSNAELISKCGLDAYFFLRYLRMLLKIFIPSAFVVLPILIPINSRTPNNDTVRGLDKLGWQNYDPKNTQRFWAHLLLAVGVIVWTCYVVHDELRGYIRVRQAYLTSPQHRLRASANTVLVTSIPRKWLSHEALDGLYDVFPGGIRNIWINRNYDELHEKVELRDQLALKLEAAETALIRKVKEKHIAQLKKAEKQAGLKRTKKETVQMQADSEKAALQMAQQPGLSSGNPHQVQTLDEALGHNHRTHSSSSSSDDEPTAGADRPRIQIPVIGPGLDAIGHGFAKLGRNIVGLPKKVEGRMEAVNEGGGDETVEESLDGAADPRPSLHESEPYVSDGRARQGTATSQTPLHAPNSRNSESPMPPVTAQDTQDTQDTQYATAHEQPAVEVTSPSFIDPPTSATEPPKATDWTKNAFLEPTPHRGWKFWKDGHDVVLPSPEPNQTEPDSFPLGSMPRSGNDETESNHELSKTKLFSRKKKADKVVAEVYPEAYDEAYADDKGGDQEPLWKRYLSPKDRDTMRLPLFGLSWMPFMPSWLGLGKKVDTIYYCRRELARLNMEIEQDQQEPQKYPLMNSAFIQFNHQVAAHMACQSVSHHVPNHMAPRIVEIAPGDIIWDNLSIKWWERFLRKGVVFLFITGLVIAWAVPVSLSSITNNLSTLATFNGFHWISKLPVWLISALQGILPWLIVTILLALLPLILRFAARLEGVHTGMAVELSVQTSYFAFLFVQLFLVVTIATSVFKVIKQLTSNPTSVPTILAKNIPRSANYFFSYILLQALSVSAGSLAQVKALAIWFLWRPIVDNTARQKFNRQLKLPSVKWGTFFPIYTNLACIGLIYSIIAPLIMIFNVVTFSLFWVAYRYQTLYINQFRFDTGGLLFPTAVNQLFTGIYVMELGLIGLFLLVRDTNGNPSCYPQAIVIVVLTIATMVYQITLNVTFSPLYRYMPITLEDDAVRRDEEFARAHGNWNKPLGGDGVEDPNDSDGDIEDALERRERNEESQERVAEESEKQDIARRRRDRARTAFTTRTNAVASKVLPQGAWPRVTKTWADRSRNKHASVIDGATADGPGPSVPRVQHRVRHAVTERDIDLEAGAGAKETGRAIGDALFGTFSDEISDLTPEERDRLIQRAFLHEALRARRPVVWIPRDELGVSDDEIVRTQKFSGKIWISNEFTGLDGKGRVVFRRAPPDFSEVDLVDL